jgi:zinc transporter ZupT
MNIARPVMFSVATLAVGIAAAAPLPDILLPFAAGILLAYLLDASQPARADRFQPGGRGPCHHRRLPRRRGIA